MFYRNTIADLRNKNPSQWYSSLKRISGHDQKSEKVIISEIFDQTDDQQAEAIAEYLSSIPNEYNALRTDDIEIHHFSEEQVLQFHPSQVWLQLTIIKTNKYTVCGDLPARLIKEFAAYIAEPFTDIINTSLRRGEFPKSINLKYLPQSQRYFPLKQWTR